MGLKLSCIHRGSSLSRQGSQRAAPVRVIAADGSLKEFPASSPVAAVLGLGSSGEDAVAPSSFFVCNSDALYFNEHPPALAPGDLLRPGQIYFVLPAAMLGRPLSSAEMAELAVRASSALALSSSSSNKVRRRHGRSSGGKKKKKKAMRVMPVRDAEEQGGDDVFFNQKLNEQTLGEFGLMPPPSPARRTGAEKVAARLRRALSVIRE